MRDEENQEKIKVVDRRRFTEEGDTKEKSIDQVIDKVEERPTPSIEQQQENDKQQYQQPPLDFPSFIVGLATQAMTLLGEIPDPQSGSSKVNLHAAQQTIDIIAILEEKTRGNLTNEEKKLVEEVLASLRLAYVRKIKR
jgi:hypothetical protein